MGPFALAVTRAAECGSDSWEVEYYRCGGRWPDARAPTYMETRYTVLGPEWVAWARQAQAMRDGCTHLANFRREREVSHA